MATKSTYNVHKANASTTLNEIYPSQSFHLDETMVVGKVISSSLISGGPYRKRALMQFTSFVTQSGYDKAYLQVYEALAKDQQTAGMIEIGFQSSSTATGNFRVSPLAIFISSSNKYHQHSEFSDCLFCSLFLFFFFSPGKKGKL